MQWRRRLWRDPAEYLGWPPSSTTLRFSAVRVFGRLGLLGNGPRAPERYGAPVSSGNRVGYWAPRSRRIGFPGWQYYPIDDVFDKRAWWRRSLVRVPGSVPLGFSGRKNGYESRRKAREPQVRCGETYLDGVIVRQRRAWR